MSNINQIGDFTDFLIGLLFADRQEESFEKMLSLNPEHKQVQTDISKCLDYLCQFSEDEEYQKTLMNLDSLSANEEWLREMAVYKQGMIDGIRICRMLMKL